MASENDKFIRRYMPGAIFEGLRSGILPSVKLSQAVIESGWGRSSLSEPPYYNFFGIKAHGWESAINFPTQEFVNGQYITINSNFRDYRSASHSFRDHTNFLKENDRYKPVFDQNDYVGQTNALKQAGYATSPTYNYALQKTIETNDLDRYDWLVKYRFLIAFIICLIILFIVITIVRKTQKK